MGGPGDENPADVDAARAVRIVGPALRREADCHRVLASLPEWFGIERAVDGYVRATATMPTFAVEVGAELVAFISLRQHFEAAWEIHCMAVAAASRHAGLGRRLLRHAEGWLRHRGARFLQVKTLASDAECPFYAATRAFYRRVGFTPLEVFPTLWSPSHPVLLLVKQLDVADPGDQASDDDPGGSAARR